jgi:hypothetical protein
MMLAALACGERVPERDGETGGAPPDSLRTPAARAAGCPSCEAMLQTLPAGAFAADPHAAARCDACHHPHWGDREVPVHRSCTATDCHPRAWPRTRFHRVDSAAFLRCTNCHLPHTWTARGTDCLSCHAGLLQQMEARPVRAFAGGPGFAHGVHREIECGRCHDLEEGHGVLRLAGRADCIACHHGPPAVAACERCHAPGEIAGPRRRDVALELAVWDAPRRRTLPFDHARHAGVGCATCHEPGPTMPARDRCASCHEPHHGAEARCIACHTTPPAAGAHDLSVHAGGCNACHGPASFETMRPRRDFCLSCHQPQVDHMPGRNCAACHKLGPAPEGTLP